MNTCIVVNGKKYDIGVRVVLWNEEKGFNGYDQSRKEIVIEDRKTGKISKKVIVGKRYSKRAFLTKKALKMIDKFVIHHTGGFKATTCFNTLHFERKLSCPYIISDRGVIYQTLDVIEKAWHAGDANPFSVGAECVLYTKAAINPNAYSERRQEKFKLASHEVIKCTTQGVKRKVFAMPKEQLHSLACVIAGTFLGISDQLMKIGISSDPYVPLFMLNEDGGIQTSYDPKWRKHKGMLLHANITPNKWDAVGINYPSFEKQVEKIYYKLSGSLIS